LGSLESRAVACLTALMIVVFGMKYLLIESLNLKELTYIKAIKSSPRMEVYFVHLTLVGAGMHLFILSLIMDVLPGTI